MPFVGLRYLVFVFGLIVAATPSFAMDHCEATIRAAQTEAIRMVLKNYKDLSTDVYIEEETGFFRFHMSRHFDPRLRALVAKDFEGIFRYHNIPVTVSDLGKYVEVRWQEQK